MVWVVIRIPGASEINRSSAVQFACPRQTGLERVGMGQRSQAGCFRNGLVHVIITTTLVSASADDRAIDEVSDKVGMLPWPTGSESHSTLCAISRNFCITAAGFAESVTASPTAIRVMPVESTSARLWGVIPPIAKVGKLVSAAICRR